MRIAVLMRDHARLQRPRPRNHVDIRADPGQCMRDSSCAGGNSSQVGRIALRDEDQTAMHEMLQGSEGGAAPALY